MEHPSAVIRRYREADLGAVYDVCVRTGDAGADARGKYRSDDLLPDLFAGPYIFLEPDFAFVLDDGNRAVGYLLGTPDTALFARAYRERWIPRLAGRYPVPPRETNVPPEQTNPKEANPEEANPKEANPKEANPKEANTEEANTEETNPEDRNRTPAGPVDPDDAMIALHYRPERMLWPGLAEYPAHLHIDLLPPFQGAGHGRALMETFFAVAARAGAAGVHVAVMAANVRAIGFYHRLGFRALEVEVEGGGEIESSIIYLGRPL